MTRQKVSTLVQAAAAAVLIVAALGITLQCWTYHRPAAPVVAAGPSQAQLDFERRQQALMAELDRLNGRYGCLAPDTWTVWRSRIKQYPVHMIVQPVNAAGLPTWDLVVKPWSMADIGGYVKGLCIK